MPNMFWGWGGEDDDIRNRVHLSGQVPYRLPQQLGRYQMHKHELDTGNEVNDIRHRLTDSTDILWRLDGYSNLQYTLYNRTKHACYTELLVDL